ncbi:MAG TPA: antibiotic biosynthesis monooxygenase [Polyangiaceae bacterium]|nr:antibiotic biosynthesis monooxygenase [Polyangiaceae bacterium]
MALSESVTPVLVLIRTTLRPDCDVATYEAMDARMNELLREIPGYLGVKGYTAEDGESVAIAEFASHEALVRWRDHPEHVAAQRAGRERFYASYDVRVCGVERAYEFSMARVPQRLTKVGA